jgi:hypothetical protein
MISRRLAALATVLVVLGSGMPVRVHGQASFPAAAPAAVQTGAQSPAPATGAQSPTPATGARSSGGFSLRRIVDQIVVPIGDIIIQLLYALAFVFFLYGIVRLYFSEDEKQRAAGKQYAIWGLLGIAILFAVWGFVNVLLNVLTEFAV